MQQHQQYMQRCLQLAGLGKGFVAPNPMVGAVLLHKGRIIGEGYHRQWGGPHAEVNCLQSVKEEDRQRIPDSTLYVSLEPCAHFGKTPPCADLIIQQCIPNVVIGCRDPFFAVDGKGIEKLLRAGVNVETGILEEECQKLNTRFFMFHQHQRPFVLLKWAQSKDGKIAGLGRERLLISNEYTNRLVHQWRSEEMAILVGTNTALADDPSLTTRLWPGKSPVRLVIDMNGRLPKWLRLFDGDRPTIVFNRMQHTVTEEWTTGAGRKGTGYYRVKEETSLVRQIVDALYSLNIQSLLVEGGAQLLQSFIDEEIWDEARVITNMEMTVNGGLPSPQLQKHRLTNTVHLSTDEICFYQPSTGNF